MNGFLTERNLAGEEIGWSPPASGSFPPEQGIRRSRRGLRRLAAELERLAASMGETVFGIISKGDSVPYLTGQNVVAISQWQDQARWPRGRYRRPTPKKEE